MIIGILSDTHDRADTAAAAIRILRDHGAEFFIHCGDVGSERVLEQLLLIWSEADVFAVCDFLPEGERGFLRGKRVTTSFIQRKLQIGYNRAARLVERMEEEGIVSPANHAGKREILREI